jgi:hypothetical protein
VATIVAKATGNWSATGTWTGDVVPGANDIAQTGAYTVTIDQSITCTRIEATSTGHWVISNADYSITADVKHAGTYDSGGLRVAHSSGTLTITGNVTTTGLHPIVHWGSAPLTVSGNVTGGSGAQYGIHNINANTVNVTGICTGGTGSNSHGVNNDSTGTINITGSVVGGGGGGSSGVYNKTTGTVTVTGNATGGSTGDACGAWNHAGGTVTVSGTCTGGSYSSAYGARNQSTGTLNVDTAIASSTAGAVGLYGLVSGGTTTFKRISAQTNGNCGIGGFCKIVVDATVNAVTYKSAGGDVTLSNDYPAITDVRSGVNYNRNTLQGTLTSYGCPDGVNVLDSAGGTYHAPDAAEVLSTAVFGPSSGTSGTYHTVTAAQVLDSVSFGVNSGTTGTYHAPLAAEVIDTAVFGVSSGTSGTVHQPSAGEVIDTAIYGPSSGTSGTFAVPPEAKVEKNYTYGAGGTEFTGELEASAGGGGVTIEALTAELGVG